MALTVILAALAGVVGTGCARASADSSGPTGQIVVRIVASGGPPPGSTIYLSGHAVFVGRDGVHHKFAVDSGSTTVTLPLGRYSGYATSSKFDGGSTHCAPEQPIVVSHTTRQVRFVCAMK